MKASAARTYDRILDRGLDIISSRGLGGITIGVLADSLGMSKSGLFAHFRSKEDMQLRIMRHADALVMSRVVEPAMAMAEGLPRLTALVGFWLGWAQRAGLSGGCPVASAMFELDDVPGDVRALVEQAERQWTALLAGLVRDGIRLGALRDDLDVDQFLWELRGIYLSHHVSSRFVADVNADDRARQAFAALVDRGRR